VGQGCELAGDAVGVERLLDVVAPRPRAHQTGLEAVRLPELEADMAGRRPKRRVRHAGRPAAEHARLLAGKAGSLAAGELLQDGDVAPLDLLDPPLPRTTGEARGKPHDLVDDVEVLGVVDKPARVVDLGVDAGPETDVGFEPRRERQEFFGTDGRACEQDGGDCEEKGRGSRHGCD